MGVGVGVWVWVWCVGVVCVGVCVGVVCVGVWVVCMCGCLHVCVCMCVYVYQWFNDTVRITNCLIEGGVASDGGGILLSQWVISTGSSAEFTAIPTTDVLFISNTQFVCNQAYGVGSSSLKVQLDPTTLNFPYMTPAITKKFTIINTTFDGTCSEDQTHT